jgi:hypothetical protein
VEEQTYRRHSDPDPLIPRLVKADRNERCKWIIAILIMLTVAAISLPFLTRVEIMLFALFDLNDPGLLARLLIVIYSAVSLLAVLVIIAGIELIKASQKVNRKKVYPAPGMKVVIDTWVVRGKQACLLSYHGFAIGILLIVVGSAVPVYFHDQFGELLSGLHPETMSYETACS